MGIYREVYDFASKAGALEGDVYQKGKSDLNYLPGWVDNLVNHYHRLPNEVKEDFQSLCNGTIGRTVQFLLLHLGEDHELIIKLESLTPIEPKNISFPHGGGGFKWGG